MPLPSVCHAFPLPTLLTYRVRRALLVGEAEAGEAELHRDGAVAPFGEAAAAFGGVDPQRAEAEEDAHTRTRRRVWIVGSGWEGDYSLEDSLAAGAVVSAALELAVSPHVGVRCANDEALAALALWQQWHHDTETCLRAASHGQRLIGIGNHDADFACCASVDNLTIVPTQTSPGVLQAA